ncbi:MAG: HAD family hydrolase [FCB group bacterium]|nr:HAD family hydrolase [FCB group bacterium]
MIYSGVKGVIFDLGSTLIEYENRDWTEIALDGQRLGYKQLLDSDHVLPDFETFNARLEEIKGEFRQVAISTLNEWNAIDAPTKLLTELGLENAKEQGWNFMEAFYSFIRDPLTVEDGARKTLKSLMARGFKTGLISNTIFEPHQHDVDIKMFGLMPYLGFRIYSTSFGKRKPHKDIFLAGLEEIGLTAEETVYVGDRFTEDVEGPLGVGIRPILKKRAGREYPDELPDGVVTINKLSELLDIVQK